MPILQNIFKKADSKLKPAQGRKQVREELVERPKSKQPKQDSKKGEISKDAKAPSGSTVVLERAHGAYNVLVRPHISEKSVRQNEKNKYVFEIYPGINAHQVKNAIESTYGVRVEKVHISRVPQKPTRFRRMNSVKNRNNKAIVTLKTGQQIEVLPQ